TPEQLGSHLRVFPEGQFVAIDRHEDRVVGMCASLIVLWERYDMLDCWEDFTANGMFTNHDAQRGRTLYGAEIIVDPTLQGHGIGGKLYAIRRELGERLRLVRIPGGAPLRSYHPPPARAATAARRLLHHRPPWRDRRPDPELPPPRGLPRAGGRPALPERRPRQSRLRRAHRVAEPPAGRAASRCGSADAVPAQG